MVGPRLRALIAITVVATSLATTTAEARSVAPPSIGAMARSAARVFRGRCSAVVVETAIVGGVRVPVTAYTFRVAEHLKGDARATVTFRQVGTPAGGPRDLGALVGLPVFARDTEYVLFLLPEGRAGITSPAGAGDGAFIVRKGEVASVRGGVAASGAAPATVALAPAARTRAGGRAAPADEPHTYEALRRAVLDELAK